MPDFALIDRTSQVYGFGNHHVCVNSQFVHNNLVTEHGDQQQLITFHCTPIVF
jgi:hypothetical protein